jgi:hypothetical protein
MKYKCSKCKEQKDIENFSSYRTNKNNDKKRRSSYCKLCLKVLRDKYQLENKQKIKEKRLQEKLDVIKSYNCKCNCCGETNHKFLTIDHVYGRNEDEKVNKSKHSGLQLYRYLKKMGYPKEKYQLLCWNCNSAKFISGYCPHQKEKYEKRRGGNFT